MTNIELNAESAGTTIIFFSNILLGIKAIDRIIASESSSLLSKFFKSTSEKIE
jgi:hypothetical protein